MKDEKRAYQCYLIGAQVYFFPMESSYNYIDSVNFVIFFCIYFYFFIFFSILFFYIFSFFILFLGWGSLCYVYCGNLDLSGKIWW